MFFLYNSFVKNVEEVWSKNLMDVDKTINNIVKDGTKDDQMWQTSYYRSESKDCSEIEKDKYIMKKKNKPTDEGKKLKQRKKSCW